MEDKEFHTVRGYQLLEQNRKLLTTAMEDYLEMIYRDSLEEGYIRVNKLSEHLHVKASSTSKMIQKLGELGLLNYERYGIIKLTEKGKELGAVLLERHKAIEEFLCLLECKNTLAQAELIEHYLDADSISKIKRLNSFLTEHTFIYEMFRNYKGC